MKIHFTILFAFLSQAGFAQKGFFVETKINAAAQARETATVSQFSVHRIHSAGLRKYLAPAQPEFPRTLAGGIPLEVPLPNGTVEVFEIFESSILAPAIAKKHPEIKTYSGKGKQHPNYSLRINFTSSGFSAIILGVENDAVYFEKLDKNSSDSLYQSYFARDAVSPENGKLKNANNRCGALDLDLPQKSGQKGASQRANAALSTGGTLRTFKLAMAATAEFTAHKGGTQISAFNALTNYVNNLNAVYQKELSVAFVLVSDEALVYTDAATDPYNNDDQEAMLSQNQQNLDAALGNTGYDIGHVLGYTGGSGGGIAANPSVCDPAEKAQGASGVGDGSYAEVFDFQLVAHEVGHQFGMSHSYNSNVPVCTTRSFGTSVEPGAGTTIMSYGYTCSNSDPGSGLVGNDDYEAPYAPFLNFHAVSLDQANTYIATLDCFAETATGNAVPVITAMQTAYVIPKSTPFVLEALATDGDAANVLSYSWEGTNVSSESDKAMLTASTISDDTKPPFFRSYPPVESNASSTPGKRYYPRLSAVLDGSNYAKGDKLPSIGIATTHTLTVRDNLGGVVSEKVTVDIDGNSGPFLVTNDPSGTKKGNNVLTVEWSVNGTTAAPINCTLVDISVSLDGGNTFPLILASGVPNSGSAAITLPDTSTTEARIKVAASTSTADGNSPNIFFDISNQNFSIEKSSMPVRLISFDVSAKESGTALLSWKTADEVNNAGFEIEMGYNPGDFVKVGFVGENGGNTINSYQYSIDGLVAGRYYFRLKQIDHDGTYAYSKIQALLITGNSREVAAIYPNPAGDKISINTNFFQKSTPVFTLFDSNGNIVLTSVGTITGSRCEIDISKLAPGLYTVTTSTGSDPRPLRFFKL